MSDISMTEKVLTVVGAGLAGTEAAYQAAKRGVHVRLIEMKPDKMTPAHQSDKFAELVCSNSLRSDEMTNAAGLLKAELRIWGSLVMEAADSTRVAAGCALAVDRELFSSYITDKIHSNPNIEVIKQEVREIPPAPVIIATGPLTSDDLAADIKGRLGRDSLSFNDAAAPIVDAATVDMTKAFFASRYGKGDADYLNCPMDRGEYDAFYDSLMTAQTAELHDIDLENGKPKVFEGCMPVEIMGARGRDTLRYGPMKPIGIINPATGKDDFYAVVQLRRENTDGTMYNLVGFQTHLTFSEQRRVFRMIPGLENADFVRYGVMHRNTYLNSPGLLTPYYSLASDRDVWFAGQMTGVEGYIESTASGFTAGVCAAARLRGIPEPELPRDTVAGALAHFVSEGSLSGDFQPMNANFGIVPPLGYKVRGGKRARNEKLAQRALEAAVATANDPALI